MKNAWMTTSLLLLAFWVTGSQADEPTWHARPTASSATPATDDANAAVLGRPVAAIPAASADTPAVVLGQPQALRPQTGMQDRQLLQASFAIDVNGLNSPVVRAKGPDSPSPMPLGDPIKGPTITDTPTDKPMSGPMADVLPVPDTSFGPVISDGSNCGCSLGSCCADNCCVPCGGCLCGQTACDSYCFWIRPELLLWAERSDHTPPLVTTGPQSSLGALGQQGTSVLYGGNINYGVFAGGRLTAGMWIDPDMEFGVEGSGFLLQQKSKDFSAASFGSPVLARPITSPTGASGVEQIANLAEVINGVLVLPTMGSVSVHSTSELWGAEVNGIIGLFRGDWGRLDVLGGFRYMNLHESMDIHENVAIAATSPVMANTTFDVLDSFGARNRFYGGQVGLRSELYWGNWQLDITGKVAFGDTNETANIFGQTAITPMSSPTVVLPGGLLALPTNIGSHTFNHVSVVPEVGINLGYQLTPHWRIFAGYDFLYWNHVVRPGSMIDTVVNVTQVPRFGGSGATLLGPARPAYMNNDTSYWAQGANIGIEFRY